MSRVQIQDSGIDLKHACKTFIHLQLYFSNRYRCYHLLGTNYRRSITNKSKTRNFCMHAYKKLSCLPADLDLCVWIRLLEG